MDVANVREEKCTLVEEEASGDCSRRLSSLTVPTTGTSLALWQGNLLSADIFLGLALFASLTSVCGCFSYFFVFCGRSADGSECLPHLSLGPSRTPCAADPYTLLGDAVSSCGAKGRGEEGERAARCGHPAKGDDAVQSAESFC